MYILKRMILLVFIEMGNDLEKLGQSYTFTALCGIITILGFVITIFVFFRTRSIDKKVEAYKAIKEYNKRRESLRTSLLDYRNAIILDDVEIIKIKSNILDDLNVLYENYKITYKFWQKIKIKRLIWHLEKKKDHNRNWICNQLSKTSGYLYLKKEDVL